MPRWATARSASVTDPGEPTASTTKGKPPISIWWRLRPTTREPLERGQLLPVPVVGVAEHDVVRAAGAWPPRAWCGWRASTVTGQAGNRPRERGERGQPDDAGAHDQDGLAVDGHGAQQAVAGDGDRLVEAGAAVGDGVGHRVEHGVVRQHAVRPAAAEVLGVAQRPSRADDAAVEVQARGGPAPGAVGARRVDPPGQAGDAGVDDDSRPDGHRAVGPRLDDPPGRLVAEDEGEGPDGGQGG